MPATTLQDIPQDEWTAEDAASALGWTRRKICDHDHDCGGNVGWFNDQGHLTVTSPHVDSHYHLDGLKDSIVRQVRPLELTIRGDGVTAGLVEDMTAPSTPSMAGRDEARAIIRLTWWMVKDGLLPVEDGGS